MFDIKFLVDFVKFLVDFLEFLLHLLKLGAFFLGSSHYFLRFAVISEDSEPYDYHSCSDASDHHVGTVVEGELYRCKHHQHNNHDVAQQHTQIEQQGCLKTFADARLDQQKEGRTETENCREGQAHQCAVKKHHKSVLF